MQHSDAATRDGSSSKDLALAAAALLDRLRTQRPRVHCITNTVAQNFTANMLLAAGCVPSMTLSADEIAAFVVRTQALLVNLGTFDRERREAIAMALDAAVGENVPWVLDPVFIDASPLRAASARDLATRSPQAIRLNRAEFSALAGREPSPAGISAYARERKTVLALSGETDLVSDGTRSAAIANGHALMAKVTGMGCAASALLAACLAVERDAWRAAAGALTMLGVAGELAALDARGSGSFAAAVIDALYNLDGPTLIAGVRVS